MTRSDDNQAEIGTEPPPARLYRGTVFHKRLKPFVHALEYSVFSLFLDLDDLGGLDRRTRLFGHNRWAPISIHDRDYGRRDGTSIRDWVNDALRAFDIDPSGGSVRMLTFPRLWGYAFNPLSIYYCYGGDNRLQAILYEVSNTFGQSHAYLIAVDGTSGAVHQETAKVFHVSPFIEMDCRYQFSLSRPGEKLGVLIRQSDAAGDPILVARHTAKGQPLNDRAMLAALFRHPLMTLKVIAGIHWEALKLWLKGARYHPKPAQPANHLSR